MTIIPPFSDSFPSENRQLLFFVNEWDLLLGLPASMHRCLFLSAKILKGKKNRANSNTARSCENKYAWVNINKYAALDRLSGSPKLSIPRRTIKTDYVLEGLWGG